MGKLLEDHGQSAEAIHALKTAQPDWDFAKIIKDLNLNIDPMLAGRLFATWEKKLKGESVETEPEVAELVSIKTGDPKHHPMYPAKTKLVKCWLTEKHFDYLRRRALIENHRRNLFGTKKEFGPGEALEYILRNVHSEDSTKAGMVSPQSSGPAGDFNENSGNWE